MFTNKLYPCATLESKANGEEILEKETNDMNSSKILLIILNKGYPSLRMKIKKKTKKIMKNIKFYPHS